MGPQRGALLQDELGIHTLYDLLNHFPFRYVDKTQIHTIRQLHAGLDYVQLAGVITRISKEGEGRKRRVVATLRDETGKIDLVWFNASWLTDHLREQERYVVFGKLTFFSGLPGIVQPEIEPKESAATMNALQPIYPSTEKLKARGINNRSFSKLTTALFERISEAHLPEILPHRILQQYGLCDRFQAYQWIHFPKQEAQIETARRRLKWEELFLSQLKIAQIRLHRTVQRGFLFEQVGSLFNDYFHQHLPFPLTQAQKRVLREIRTDTLTGKQMNRLLQGDVGSGKTIVALMCMLLALDNGFQACLMAPTEILAQQHYHGIKEQLSKLPVQVSLLTGSVKGKTRKQTLQALEAGLIHILIGTHALIEDHVRFQNLGLAIVDEQHRFGVGQRAKLWQKNTLAPHMLVMTATPIPRTLAMTLYGDLDVSIIDEMPPGRKEIKTVHRNESHRPRVLEFIRSEIDKGRQAYIVYPLIEESEKVDYESLMAGYEQVRVFFPDHRYHVAMVHGRQEEGERQRNMQRFVTGEAQILVATTVIEVGVNVPNASVMLIESAERFGLSQIHQLRGRVGRGSEQSYCILLTGSKMSTESARRMQIMTQTTDGFVIAEEDLAMRGPGDLYGTRQSGLLQFKLADIVADADILEESRTAAKALLALDPNLEDPGSQGIKQFLLHEGSQSEWKGIS